MGDFFVKAKSLLEMEELPMCAKTGLERKIHQDIQTEILNLDYSRISRESG